MIDTYRHKGLREKLVNELRNKGIIDKNVLAAIGKIPRHFMLDKAFADWAYKDQAFPIEANQTISQPYTVAIQSQLLEVKRGEVILEVGTGSGYQAAVLYELGAKVYSIERQSVLFDRTSKLLVEMGYVSIRTLLGDGYEGAERFAPFDKILVTAGAATFPSNLMTQLKIGGLMVLPYGPEGKQQMMRYRKTTLGNYETENLGACSFVPMLNGIIS